ncbi:MAG: DUF948 domain-containing protein [Gammaproteobacteria bacterium]
MESLMKRQHSTPLRKTVLAMLISQALMLPNIASAVTDEVAAHIAKLERTVAVLVARVNQLEAEKGSQRAVTKPTAEDAKAQSEKIASLERNVSQLSESMSKPHTEDGLPLHGFVDVGMGYSNKLPNYAGGRPNGFTIGSFDMYLTPRLGDHVKSLIEANIERSDAGDVNIDLERLQVGYVFGDSITAWLGRFHTPYGAWNTAYHHGAQIQTSIMRPRFIAFEDQGGILPAHTVGLWATGNTPAGAGKMTYDVFLGNGSRIKDDTLDMNNAKDDNRNTAVGFNAGYKFGATLSGLKIGVHGLSEEVDAYNTSTDTRVSRTQLNMYGGYTTYDENDWDVIGEYYSFHNKDLRGGTGTHSSWAGFLQVGRLMLDRWTPYVRYEKAVLDQSDNYFATQFSGRSYARGALGVRYDIEAKSALKFETDHTQQKDNSGPNYNEFRVQYSVRF